MSHLATDIGDICRLTLATLFAGLAVAAPAAPYPARIVSMNLCTDSMLMELVEPVRIAAVTHLSRDPNLSNFHALAELLAINHGFVEEIVLLEPDLVLTGANTSPPALRLLIELDLDVRTFPAAAKLEDYRNNLMSLAHALGATERALALLRRLDADIAATRRAIAHKAPLRALIYGPNGFSPGMDTLMNDLLGAAGLINIVGELGMRHGGFVALEQLMLLWPRVLIFNQRDSRRPSLAQTQLEHPALRRFLTAQTRPPIRIDIPERLWTCGGAFAADVVRRLARAHR